MRHGISHFLFVRLLKAGTVKCRTTVLYNDNNEKLREKNGNPLFCEPTENKQWVNWARRQSSRLVSINNGEMIYTWCRSKEQKIQIVRMGVRMRRVHLFTVVTLCSYANAISTTTFSDDMIHVYYDTSEKAIVQGSAEAKERGGDCSPAHTPYTGAPLPFPA